MKIRHLLTLISMFLFGLPLFAQSQGTSGDQYILTTYTRSVKALSDRHGLTHVATVWSNPKYIYAVYLVAAPPSNGSSILQSALQSEVSSDPETLGFERNQSVAIEQPDATSASLAQSTTSFLDSLRGSTPVSFNGVIVPKFYVQQPATTIIRWSAALLDTRLTGAGTVAVIDTGVDPAHPALAGVLVPGYDFTRNTAGMPSELADLNSQTAASLAQSTTSFLDGNGVVQVSGSTLAILDQSTTSFLDGTLPPAFGHGTMTAGLVHLIAPTAKIMPLKAFRADGSSDTYSIIRAIYYAVDHGANIISMSFEMAQASPGLRVALDYASANNVVSVASAGNDAQDAAVFPAGLSNVIGIGSTNNFDQRSAFSNFGSTDVTFAAPGEGVISTYPGNHYAAGWGTSFSAPIVAGASSLILQKQRHKWNSQCLVMKALRHAVPVPLMGYGRIDLYRALTSTNHDHMHSGCSLDDLDLLRPD
jgi:thermitase